MLSLNNKPKKRKKGKLKKNFNQKNSVFVFWGNHSKNGDGMGAFMFENKKFLFSKFRREDWQFLGPSPEL